MTQAVRRRLFLGSCLTGLCGYALPLSAEARDAAARGVAVAREWHERDRGFRDSRAAMNMILRSRTGQQSVRRFKLEVLETEDPEVGNKTLVTFDQPRDFSGTTLLIHGKIRDADDIWLYLPALRRVKRVSTNNRAGAFVGSEFAYEDIGAQELGKFSYQLMAEKECGQELCFVVEQTPLYEHSGYTRQLVWYDRSEYRQQRIEYFNRRNELHKTLTLGEYRKYANRHWRAHRMHMANHETGKSTEILIDEWHFRVDLSANDFTPARLRLVR